MKKNTTFQTNRAAILLAAYNGEKYISGQIDSLLSQSYTAWDLVVHDDGSCDRTMQILAEYQKKYTDKIHILGGPPTGGSKQNFMYLLRQVEAPYYFFCDQDDVWLPEKMDVTYRKMTETESASAEKMPCLVFTDLTVVDESLNVIAHKMSDYQKLDYSRTDLNHMLIQNQVSGCTMMINRQLRDLVIQADSTEKMIMHDWWCALTAACFGRIAVLEQPTILYRQHGDNSVGAQDVQSAEYIRRKISRKEQMYKGLDDTRRQAGYFAKLYGKEETAPAFSYASVAQKSKLFRIIYYFRNHTLKTGLIRNIGLILYG